MNIRKSDIRNILLTLFLIACVQHDIFSQGTDISISKQQHFYIGFNISPTQTSIINNGSITIKDLDLARKNSYFFAFETGYSFSKFFGISTGIGYSSYLSDFTLDSYNNSYDTTDSDIPKDTYTRNITGSNITEIQKISFLSIPVAVNFHLPVSNYFGFYLQSGINISVPVKKSYNSTGTFTYEGYYEAYNLHITNIAYEGFKKDAKNNVDGDLKIKTLNPEFFASAGIQLTLRNKVQIAFGVLYNKMISNISDYPSSGSFRLTSVPDQMKSIMEGSTETSTQSVGLKISFRYFLR